MQDDLYCSSKKSKKRAKVEKLAELQEHQRRLAARHAARQLPPITSTTAECKRLQDKEEELERRARELKQRETRIVLSTLGPQEGAATRLPPHEAMEKILMLCHEEVRKKQIDNATDDGSAASAPAANVTPPTDPWRFQDVNGSMTPVAPYMKPALDWLRDIGSANPVTRRPGAAPRARPAQGSAARG